MKSLFLAVAMALVALPAIADDCVFPLGRAVEAAKDVGWKLATLDDVKDDLGAFDQVVTFETDNGTVAGLVLRGCMVSRPFDVTPITGPKV